MQRRRLHGSTSFWTCPRIQTLLHLNGVQELDAQHVGHLDLFIAVVICYLTQNSQIICLYQLPLLLSPAALIYLVLDQAVYFRKENVRGSKTKRPCKCIHDQIYWLECFCTITFNWVVVFCSERNNVLNRIWFSWFSQAVFLCKTSESEISSLSATTGSSHLSNAIIAPFLNKIP